MPFRDGHTYLGAKKINFVDYKFLMMVSPRLQRFKDQGNRVYNCRCPFCGDGKTDQKKARGYILYNSKKDSVGYYCYNCGASYSFSTFLKLVAPDLHGDYKMEAFGLKVAKVTIPADASVTATLKKTAGDTQKVFGDVLGKCHRLSKCPTTLEAVKRYAEGRKIPESLFSELYACHTVMDILTRVPRYKDTVIPDAPMLVIPFFNKEGDYDFIQCRDIRVEVPPRYRFVTIQVKDDGSKLYGENRVNWTEPVYVLEGPIDAMFIDNGVSTAGAAAGLGYLVERTKASNLVMLFDNELTTNEDILNHVKSCMAAGMGVVLFDKEFDGIKDINKAVVDYGWSVADINTYVRSRTFHGLRASLELAKMLK